jgi:hypothetical protein
MARLVIHYRPSPDTGERQFLIALASDEDATPREHEQDHRRLVRQLLPGIDLDREDQPNVTVAREQPAIEPMILPSGDDDGYEVIDLG